MKITLIADMHGNLKFSVPEADLLLVAGDLCPAHHEAYLSIDQQADWLGVEFRYWLVDQPVKECVAVAGNHDWIWEKDKKRVPRMNANFHYLEDESIELMGVKIHGTPWQLPFNNWAFNKNPEKIKLHWENIPNDTDILICHSPPYGIMDTVKYDGRSRQIGSASLRKRIFEIKPKIVVFGHNHDKYGVEEHKGIRFVNCSLVNEQYRMVKKPIVLEI